jgi:hypothetical protein
MMPLGAAALPLHLVPWIEFNVGRLDEELLVPLLDLLLQRGRVHPGQGVAVQGDQLGRNLHSRDRKKLDPNTQTKITINVPLFKNLKMSREMAHKVIVPPKKNYVPQFL